MTVRSIASPDLPEMTIFHKMQFLVNNKMYTQQWAG